jgi:hypothetical protein
MNEISIIIKTVNNSISLIESVWSTHELALAAIDYYQKKQIEGSEIDYDYKIVTRTINQLEFQKD